MSNSEEENDVEQEGDIALPDTPDEPQVELIIARTICKHHFIKTPRQGKDFCLWQNGVFIRYDDADTRIRQYVSDIAENLVLYDTKGHKKRYSLTISKLKMILEFIQNETYCDLSDFDKDPTIVNVENGLYIYDGFPGIVPKEGEKPQKHGAYSAEQLESGLQYFKSHPNYSDLLNPMRRSLTYLSFVQFPVEYDSEARCLKIDQFLEDVFGFDNVPLIYEMIGYILFGHIRHQKAFVVYGPASSGKTTFITLLMRFFGGNRPEKTISQVKLQRLSKRFQSVNLKDKVINIYDDLPKSKVGESDMFRIVVTNETLGGELKFKGLYIYWRNRCKLLFTCTELPPIGRDEGDQFWRRWILESCFTEFKNKDKMSAEDLDNPNVKEKNPNILNEICTPEEFSGLLNKALQAYRRLEERGHFPKEWDDIERVKGLWMIDVNPVKLFLDECCEIIEGERTDYYEFINAVNEFRQQHNAKNIGATMVTQALHRATTHKVERSKDRKWYLNIKIKNRLVNGELERVVSTESREGGIDGYLTDLETESKKIERDEDYSDEGRYL